MTTHLTFACELDPEPLAALFAQSAVVDHLLALEATVSLGLLDLSRERAAVVRRLNEAGVPLVAWLLLPKEQGYWFHAGNVAQAAACYQAFAAWTAEHGLRWTGIGFDVEPDYEEMGLLFEGAFGRLLPRILGRLWNADTVRRAEAAYAALAGRARADGYHVEAYQFPFIADERLAGSSLLRRGFQLVNVPADLEVWMLYGSFLRGAGPGILWSYGRETRATTPSLRRGIGVGSTGGGVELPGGPPPLSWEQFSRDLRLARRWSDEVFVFSLEGCVQHGYLDRLLDFDWQAPVEPPLEQAGRVDAVRRLARGCLWAGSRPLLLAGSVAAAAWLLSKRREK
ncbi:MAG: hypothetical protein P8129_14480 [Anaerolineae bacterium]